jgi:hypothetical protein
MWHTHANEWEKPPPLGQHVRTSLTIKHHLLRAASGVAHQDLACIGECFSGGPIVWCRLTFFSFSLIKYKSFLPFIFCIQFGSYFFYCYFFLSFVDFFFNFIPYHLISFNFYIEFDLNSLNCYLFLYFIIFFIEFYFQFHPLTFDFDIFFNQTWPPFFITICFVVNPFFIALFPLILSLIILWLRVLLCYFLSFVFLF